MAFVTEPFVAFLSAPLDAADIYLPLSAKAYADLLKLLGTKDSYTYLTICDDTHAETVRAYSAGSYIIIDRGLAGTSPVKFSYGAKVSTPSPTLVALIDSYLCERIEMCEFHEDPDAMCRPFGLAIAHLPTAYIGEEYFGHVTISGVLPMQFEVTNAPTWATVETCGNMVSFEGTPREITDTTFHVKVTNCEGSNVYEQDFNITSAYPPEPEQEDSEE